MAHEEAAGRDFGTFRDEGAGGDDGAGADFCAVENDRAHADEAARFDGAAVEDDAVADGDIVAEDERVRVAHDVKDGAVLDIAAGADADEVDVAADDDAGPDAGVGGDGYVTDDDGLRIDVGGIGDARGAAAVGPKQDWVSFCVWDASIGESDVTMLWFARPRKNDRAGPRSVLGLRFARLNLCRG